MHFSRNIFLIVLCLCGLIFVVLPISAQDTVPTLVPPTLVPTPATSVIDALPSESAVARILRDAKVRVGILYNAAPFGLLNIRGEVSGMDADIARSLAEAWGVEVEFVQVTRQTALDMLTQGNVDFLAAAQVHHRRLDDQVEFSHTYYQGGQALMVRNDDGAAVLAHMDGRKVGVVKGTPAQEAVAAWQERTGINITVIEYLTIDQGLTALVAQEIDGLVGSIIQLRALLQPGVVKILDEIVMPEPYAIAMRRQDVSLRNLVNRSLQHLAQNSRLNEIYQANFPGSTYPPGLIATWENLGDDAPKPDQFPPEITIPQQYVIPRIQGGQPVRVAGLPNAPAEDAVESEKRLYALNRGVVEALVGRWGGTVEFVPDSAANALDLVASGQADLAVGVRPDWAWADRVDFTSAYFLHGDRLLVEKDGREESFNELRGGFWVGVFGSEPGAADKVNQLASSVNTSVNIFTMVREQDVPSYILEEENADVAFGDSLKLIPHVQALPDEFRLAIRCPNCDPWYSRINVAFAVPRNDIDFRLLVEYTLQELHQDGTLDTLLQPVMLPEDRLKFDVWPGDSTYMGFALFKRAG